MSIQRLSFGQLVLFVWFLGLFGTGLSLFADPAVLEHPRYLGCTGALALGMALMLGIGRWLGGYDPRPGRVRGRESEPVTERQAGRDPVRVGEVMAPDFGKERKDRHAA